MEFSKKQVSLFPTQEKEESAFVQAALNENQVTTSGNGAKKYTTSGNVLVDQYAAISNYKEPRDYADIAADMNALWKLDPKQCIKFAVYIRLITRESIVYKAEGSEKLPTQIGQGLKHEGIMRLLWLAIHHKKAFMKNIHIFIAAGGWKDIFQMMSYDLQYHGWKRKRLDWEFFGQTIIAGLNNPECEDLVKKYLPIIRASKDCKTLESQANNLIGKYIAKCIFGLPEKEGDFSTYTKYRKLKSSGEAHLWQQKISRQDYLNIDFNTISGRALSLLVGSKFLSNHGLTQAYEKWLESKPVAKYTGYVYELFKPLGNNSYSVDIPKYQEITINKQFQQLINTVKPTINKASTFLVVRDISGSMEEKATGTSVSSFAVAKAMALYFGELLTGYFSNAFLTFSAKVTMHKWVGNTPCEKWKNDHSSAYGNTNFLGVADFFCSIKGNGVPESEFPKGILCISDGEFDGDQTTTNFMAFKERLRSAGFSEQFIADFKIVLWDVPNSFYGKEIRPKFESSADAPGFFYMSGFDPAAISFLMGKEQKGKPEPKTAAELAKASLDQELLNMIEI